MSLWRLRIRSWLAWPFDALGLTFAAYRVYGANAMQARAMTALRASKERVE